LDPRKTNMNNLLTWYQHELSIDLHIINEILYYKLVIVFTFNVQSCPLILHVMSKLSHYINMLFPKLAIIFTCNVQSYPVDVRNRIFHNNCPGTSFPRILAYIEGLHWC